MPIARLSDHALYYEHHAPEAHATNAIPLLLVVGMGGRCAGWLPLQVPRFRARRPVLIYDHRGVGESSDPGTPFTTGDLARDLIGLLDALAIERVDATGYFLGAMTLQDAAPMAPERFRRLVLVGSWARPDARRRMLLTEWAKLARSGVSADSMTRQRVIWTLSEEALEQAELIEPVIARLDDGQTPLTGELFARQCDAALAHDSLDQLGKIEHPTLALCGRRDLLTPTKFSRQIAEAMPNARDVSLSYSGHAVMAERTDRFNEIVLHFLDDSEADD